MEGRRRFAIRTYGCQMNQHDTEKVSNLLVHAGLEPALAEESADVLLINTCSIREKAEHRLYSDLGALRRWKEAVPGRLLGVGGCVAQQEGGGLLDRFAHLDFVFGTHNLREVPALLRSAGSGRRGSRTAELRSLERFDLPPRRSPAGGSAPARAFVTVMEGCDMFCTFCVVPRTRGREISRPAVAILEEARRLCAEGTRELILLGQTVNAYGRHDVRRGRAERVGTLPFAELLRRLAALPGLRRLRYTSPHPLFFDGDLVRAHAELEVLCPHVHLPLQSGSDRILASMRRRYDAATYLRIVRSLKEARPDLALTTDLIVGYPGETEADFRATLELMERVGFTDSYSFKFSPRPGTRAAGLPDPVPPEVASERLARLQALQRELTLSAHRARVGSLTEILVEGESRRGGQASGRDPYHRVVNLRIPPRASWPEPGTLLPVRVVEATPHSLIGEPEPSGSSRAAAAL